MALNYNFAAHVSAPFRRYVQATARGPNVTSVTGALPAAPPKVPRPGPDVSYQDSPYNLANANTRKQLADVKANLLNQDVGLAQDTGISVTRDPNNPLATTGSTIDANVDVTNPFSKAALLKVLHERNSSAIGNQAAAAGQLYAGSTQGSQNTEGRNFLGGQDALLKEYAAGHSGLIGQYLAASQAARAAGVNATGAALGRNENTPAYLPPKPNRVAGKTKQSVPYRRPRF